jgi:hypothetical protein
VILDWKKTGVRKFPSKDKTRCRSAELGDITKSTVMNVIAGCNYNCLEHKQFVPLPL